MKSEDLLNLENAEYIEQIYRLYQKDPASVGQYWATFFQNLESGMSSASRVSMPRASGATSAGPLQGLDNLVNAYRTWGHLTSNLDPLSGEAPKAHPLLELSEYGFSTQDLGNSVGAGRFVGPTDGTLGDLVGKLKTTYCNTVGVEFMHIEDIRKRTWLEEAMEPVLNHPTFSPSTCKRILRNLAKAEIFENFLHTKYIGQKRFSVEGCEALIPLLDTFLEELAAAGAEELTIGIAHRGRLNVLAHTCGKPYEAILAEFEKPQQPVGISGEGDVKYHQGYSNDIVTEHGKKIHVSLSPNPSHLELVDPVVEGIARAKQEYVGDTQRRQIVPVLIHGEAAFVGQGIVTETISLSQLPGYQTGGTLHVIVNNQVGFTAIASQTRFTPYPTDIAKMINVPVFHVNGDDPEAVVHVARIAAQFRQQFNTDALIDVWCFRKYGHNESDDPTFTQPQMYEKIAKHPSVVQSYAQKLIERGILTEAEFEEMKSEVRNQLEAAILIAKKGKPKMIGQSFAGLWAGYEPNNEESAIATGIDPTIIRLITERVTAFPSTFHVHPKLERLYATRTEMAEGKKPIDWGCGEMWALGSLLLEGYPVRFTGQDVERGTFSHRHAVLHDVKVEQVYTPLAHLSDTQGKLTILNTMLSELAVLGFEFGYSRANPRNLVIWEAQFGDFVNGAQPIIDQFIASSEVKWQRVSGLVMLLPHGYEGQGPEHSSARLERFLQLCGSNNIQVAYPSLPSQYFHLLRRQMHRSYRKPLVLMMPKSLLRSEKAASPISEFTKGHFQPVLDDSRRIDSQGVKRILFCAGKVYFSLLAEAERRNNNDTAIVRIEQLYPFPTDDVKRMLDQYAKAVEVAWVQEEPQNMGAWTFVQPRLSALLLRHQNLLYRGRDESASPATGSFVMHELEEERFLSRSFESETQAVPLNAGRKRKQESV